MGEFSAMHWLVVIVVMALLSGSKKRPDVARGIGQSLRVFKTEIDSDESDKPLHADT
jgi:sec-independent protein translocase protein TatA